MARLVQIDGMMISSVITDKDRRDSQLSLTDGATIGGNPLFMYDTSNNAGFVAYIASTNRVHTGRGRGLRLLKKGYIEFVVRVQTTFSEPIEIRNRLGEHQALDE